MSTIVGWGHYQVCRVLYQLLGQTDVYGMPVIYKLREFAHYSVQDLVLQAMTSAVSPWPWT